MAHIPQQNQERLTEVEAAGFSALLSRNQQQLLHRQKGWPGFAFRRGRHSRSFL
jgi:hypothetical protein